ncbi:replication endonuclease [Immundisolibacter sp.]|uniref:replication endonuclease n=1 Tax=Immundisolibacter sp. TaxID=1934948 RepID=UPI0035641F57
MSAASIWEGADIGGTPHQHDRAFIARNLNSLPVEFREPVRRQYASIFKKTGRSEANLWLLEIGERASAAPLPLTFDDDDLVLKARSLARSCSAAMASTSHVPLPTFDALAAKHGLRPPNALTPAGKAARYRCERWWRRRLRRCHGESIERLAVTLNLVNKQLGPYASKVAVHRRAQSRRRTAALMQTLLAVNELGEEFSLAELQAHSTANPRNRRAELMVRMAGFEALADRRGDVAVFYTITCPGRMHRSLSVNSDPNPRYDATTPGEAQVYLCNLWARARSALARAGVRPYGLRIAEPHHDETPHWHLLLFMPADRVNIVGTILRRYALARDPDEPGAAAHRFREVIIDPERGRATGYIAKYVSKNVDGAYIENDETGWDGEQAAARVNAWASLWRIRQFQQIGGPPVTVWRELRRLAEAPEGILETARQAADAGNWADFVETLGGPDVARKDQQIKLARVWCERLGQYREPIGYQIVGLEAGEVTLPTRLHEWRVVQNVNPEFLAASASARVALEYCQ